jgi:XTP/dITP diphosphohydrolase
MKEILFATGNKDKIMEAQAILEVPVEIATIEVDEVQSMDLEYVSRRKTEEAYRILQRPVITDDVGVFIEAWNGFPGPFAKFILDKLGNDRILEILAKETNRNVVVRSAVSYHDGKDIHIFIGEVEGTLAFEQRGTDGWGFDPIIIPNGETQTYAEMGHVKKNQLSHRRKALDKLKQFLDSQKDKTTV